MCALSPSSHKRVIVQRMSTGRSTSTINSYANLSRVSQLAFAVAARGPGTHRYLIDSQALQPMCDLVKASEGKRVWPPFLLVSSKSKLTTRSSLFSQDSKPWYLFLCFHNSFHPGTQNRNPQSQHSSIPWPKRGRTNHLVLYRRNGGANKRRRHEVLYPSDRRK